MPRRAALREKNCMNATDTNILIYANDSREPVKRQIALDLLANLGRAVLLWQVACEYIAASRKLEKFGFTQKEAFADLKLLEESWTIVLPTWKTLQQAETLIARYSVSFWDALIVAACLENGVTRLYSEDICDSFRSEGLEIINPFQAK